MSRTVVYLDQSVLSNLAKGTCFLALDDLLPLVDSDAVLFPFSWTHHRESVISTDRKLENAIYGVAAQLSRGIRFATPAHIASQQARRAYIQWANRGQGEFLRREAYERDPDGPISEKWMEKMVQARVTVSDQERDLSQRKERGPPASFDESKRWWAEDNVRFYFIDPYRKFRLGQATDLDLAMLQFGGAVLEEIRPLGGGLTPQQALSDIREEREFFQSPSCQRIPFVDINSSIHASLEFDETARPYAGGDLQDIETWSAYLPYVDAAVADQQMCAVLQRRGLAANYRCRVYPHTARGFGDLVGFLNDGSAA